VTWTLAHAKQIGIASKDNWRNYPRAMLRARCISEGIRAVYPGCVVGVYTPEEVQDFQPTPAKDMGMAEMVETIKEPDGAYRLYVPGNDEPYNRYHTVEEWMQGYVEMLSRVARSTKMPDDVKAEKLDSLKACNLDMLDTLDNVQKLKIKALMVNSGVSVSPKQAMSQPSPELAHSEQPF
jgi:hypothetical protein